MPPLRSLHRLAVAAALFAGLGVRADYRVAVQSGGAAAQTVPAGGEFRVDLLLTRTAGESHNGVILTIAFSAPGIVYRGYNWQAPYVDDSPDDFCTPRRESLPVALNQDILSGIGYPDGAIDIELSNVTADTAGGTVQYFGEGRLASLLLAIPADYSGPPTASIGVSSISVVRGFDLLPVQRADPFVLTIAAAARDGDDDDGDGLVNLVEEALGLDPKVPGRPPMAGFEPGLPVATTEESEGVTYAVFQYRKDLTRTSIRHTVMGSSDLVHWQALPDTLARAQGTVEVRQVRELLGAQPRFLRLDISRQ